MQKPEAQSVPEVITPEVVLKFDKPAASFLCSPEANIYGIQFLSFKMRNYKNNFPLLETEKQASLIGAPVTDEMRLLSYKFTQAFFDLETIGTTLEFSVEQPVKDFMMIERHYFQNELLKSYQFSVPFCMPNSKNTMQAIYDLPTFSEQLQERMKSHPYDTQSDSFYFVENCLVMHTKAKYRFEK